MTSSSLPGEDALISLLAGLLPPTRHTTLSIGDDAAAIALPNGELLLATTDLLMEDVHFRLRWGDRPALGWKALAQNLSDIAAMGGVPTHALISIALPPAWPADEAAALYRGMAELARLTQTDVVGGDTITSRGPLTISLTVLGRVPAAEMLTRRGATPGQAIFTTGRLGAAAAGLHLLECAQDIPEHFHALVQAQLRPTPRLQAARTLARSGVVTAMMDLSDGVATDLHRLCRASGVGALVEQEQLPLHPLLSEACVWLAEQPAHDPHELALYGGEDFELLFTAPATAEADLRAAIAPLPLTAIGVITAQPELLLRRRDTLAPLPWGFTHF